MIKQSDVSVTKQVNGSYECAVMLPDRRVSKVYYGYTKRVAVRLFTIYANEELANAKD